RARSVLKYVSTRAQPKRSLRPGSAGVLSISADASVLVPVGPLLPASPPTPRPLFSGRLALALALLRLLLLFLSRTRAPALERLLATPAPEHPRVRHGLGRSEALTARFQRLARLVPTGGTRPIRAGGTIAGARAPRVGDVDHQPPAPHLHVAERGDGCARRLSRRQGHEAEAARTPVLPNR